MNQALQFDDCLMALEAQGGQDAIKQTVDDVVMIIKEATALSKLEQQPDIRELAEDETLDSLADEEKRVCSEVSVGYMSAIYKAVLTLGMIANHCGGRYQALVSDRGGLDCVISCLKLSVDNRVLKEIRTSGLLLAQAQPQMLRDFGRACHQLSRWCFFSIFVSQTESSQYILVFSRPLKCISISILPISISLYLSIY